MNIFIYIYPSFSNSAIILKMVGFLLSKPKLYMAAFNSLGSTWLVPSVSNKLNASLISSISSSVNPGLLMVTDNYNILI